MTIYQDNDVIIHTATQGDTLAREKQNEYEDQLYLLSKNSIDRKDIDLKYWTSDPLICTKPFLENLKVFLNIFRWLFSVEYDACIVLI